mgnify:CR=1 FL=1
MTHSLLHAAFVERRTQTAGLLGRLAELCDRAGMADLREMTGGLLANINEPFLFVIVGEVKTGKSSLINALLGEEACPVAPDPCTDRIQIIAYGETRSEKAESALLKRVFLPLSILKDIAIVDTPGVDSIIDRHQEITEGFIPRCDLALFVFSAINPYSRSAWEFFDLVNAKWRRKIVFILNQADLASEEQLDVNVRSVAGLAGERGMAEPRIFLTSGKTGLTDPEKGGIEALRAYIREMVTGGGHYAQKLLSAIRSAGRALERMAEAQERERLDLAEDLAESDRIRERLASARKSAGREIERLVDRTTGAYAKLCVELVEEIERELRFGNMISRSVKSVFSRKKEKAIRERVRELTEAFRRDLAKEVEILARQGAEYVSESLTDRIRPLAEDLERASARRERPVSGGRFDLTAITRQREKVLAEVAGGVAGLIDEGAPLSGISPKTLESMDPGAAMGSVLVLVGAVFAVAVKSVIIDVTGGVIAGAGMLMAGSALAWKRPRLVRELKDRLAKGGGKLEEDLAERLSARMDHVFAELDDRFAPFFSNLDDRGRELEALSARRQALEQEFGQLARSLGETAED